MKAIMKNKLDKSFLLHIPAKTLLNSQIIQFKFYDFEDNFYEIDFDGKLINEELKGKQ